MLTSGWGVVGKLVNTGNVTISDMAEGKADQSGAAVDPFSFEADGGAATPEG